MRIPRLSLTTWIGLSLALGILTGLFFGEACAGLSFIGDIFIRLLQMSVLPYVFISLIANIGGLTIDQAKLLGKRISLVLVGLWGVALVLVFVLPFSLPTLESASFFSTSMLVEAPPADMVSLFVPKNPFESLSTNVVPAVVLFCVAVGLALIAVPGKEKLLEPMQLASRSLARVASFMVRLTPYGIFAIAASAAGTMSVDDLSRIQAYLLMHTSCALLLTFGIIPLSLSILTPFSYRELMRALKDPLVAGFTTGNVFITLPMLTESIKRLYADHGLDAELGGRSVEVVLPVAFSFPNVGKLLALLFIPFAAWYTGSPIELMEYPGFLLSSLAAFFGSTNVAIPFLLDSRQLPADMFQLFMLTGILGMRFGAIAAIVHHFCLGMLVSGQEQGFVGLRLKKLVPLMALSAGVVLILVVGLRAYLATAVKDTYDKDRVLQSMQLLRPAPDFRVLEGVPETVDEPAAGESRLDLIKRRGVLRVGFQPESLPGAYRNVDGKLVGFGVEMAHRLAKEMQVRLDLVPYEGARLAEHLKHGDFDVAMPGIPLTTDTAGAFDATRPYMTATLAIACPDHDRGRWRSMAAIREIDSARIAVGGNDTFFSRRIAQRYPHFEIVEIPSTRAYFEGKLPEVDALVTSAETASAWSLLYPGYGVVVPRPRAVGIPLVFPIAGKDDRRFLRFLDHWIDFKQADGTIDELRDHWIYGKSPGGKKPRWCIARDVLGWID